jgi:4-amino-4-deoxy-L-arabinose transferase-like glycosyltransferase
LSRNKCTAILIICLTLLAFALRLYRLDYQPLRGDESFSIQFSAHELEWLIPSIAHVEPNPPLYYLPLHYSMDLLGQSEFITRFLSLLFGVLSVPLIYQLGRSSGKPRVGALAALLCAINPFQVWHAQDVRNYTVWPALSMAALVFLLRALRDPTKAKCWAGYTGMTLLSLYTHYYDMFMLLFQNLFFLACVLVDWRIQGRISPKRRRVIYTWMVIQAALAAAIVPWLLYGSSRLTAITEGDSPALWTVFARCLTTFSLGETVPSTLRTLALPILLLILFLTVLTSAFKRDRHLSLFLSLYIVVPTACVFTVAQLRPLYRERYLNAIAPAFYLLFAWGLLSTQQMLRRYKSAVLVAGVAFFGLSAAYSLNNHYHRPEYQKSPDWRALAAYLASETKPGDIIILNYPDPTFSYYYRGHVPTVVLPRGFLYEQEKVGTARELRTFAEVYQRIWFHPLTDVRWDNEGFVQRWLYHHCQLLESRDIRGFRWLIYRPALNSLEDAQHRLDLEFGDAIRLCGYDAEILEPGLEEPVHVEPGSALRFTLYWQATGELEAAYAVFVHLIDDHGKIYSQVDSPPRGGDFPTDEWMPGDLILDPYSLVVPRDIPRGEYSLVVGMYDPTTAARLPIVGGALGRIGDQVAIAQISIGQ